MALRDKFRIAPEIAEHGGVLLGFSGGADSTALLRALEMWHCPVRAVHCNFHLRGAESDRDMNFCIRLCHRLGVPLEVVHFDVPGYMERHGVGMEETCRELRYAEFRRLREECGCARIAVAHNSDDNVETLLLNLFRGSGISGLRGMLPDTGEIIRPLLGVSRLEILEFLRGLDQDYITDSSNLKSDVKRNFIRNELLPLVETRWPGVRRAMTSTIQNLRSDEAVIDAAEREWLNGNEVAGNRLSYKVITSAPDAEWMIHRWGRRFGLPHHCAREIAAHLADDSLLPGKRWQADSGAITSTSDGLEYVAEAEIFPEEGLDVSRLFDVAEVRLDDSVWQEIRKDRSNKVLWLPESPEGYVVRAPRPGDRIASLGMKGTQLVADVMRDARLSPSEKGGMRIVCRRDSDEVIWIPGVKRSRNHLVQNNARFAYRIMIKCNI